MKSGNSWSGSIPPQQTWFEHVRFRSQVEARRALFFRSMELAYEYEGRWFDLGDGVRYLPDFWLPSLHCWVEVKGVLPTAKEREKARRLARHTGANVYIFYATLYFRVPLQTPDDEGWYSYSAEAFFAVSGEDDAFWWCECPVCGSLGLAEEGRAARLPCGCRVEARPESPLLLRAVNCGVRPGEERRGGATRRAGRVRTHTRSRSLGRPCRHGMTGGTTLTPAARHIAHQVFTPHAPGLGFSAA